MQLTIDFEKFVASLNLKEFFEPESNGFLASSEIRLLSTGNPNLLCFYTAINVENEYDFSTLINKKLEVLQSFLLEKLKCNFNLKYKKYDKRSDYLVEVPMKNMRKCLHWDYKTLQTLEEESFNFYMSGYFLRVTEDRIEVTLSIGEVLNADKQVKDELVC